MGLGDKLLLFKLDSGLLCVEEVEAVVYEETGKREDSRVKNPSTSTLLFNFNTLLL